MSLRRLSRCAHGQPACRTRVGWTQPCTISIAASRTAAELSQSCQSARRRHALHMGSLASDQRAGQEAAMSAPLFISQLQPRWYSLVGASCSLEMSVRCSSRCALGRRPACSMSVGWRQWCACSPAHPKAAVTLIRPCQSWLPRDEHEMLSTGEQCKQLNSRA